jgi:uncharacterized protein YbdZ (MbtH family)
MKFSLKKLFTANNVINFLYILFLFGVVYSLFSKKIVLEGWTDCMKIPNKSKTECQKYPDCRWFTINSKDRRGRIIETKYDCMDKNQGKK